MSYQIIDNFLSEGEFKAVQETILGRGFPWFFSDKVSGQEDDTDMQTYMNHVMYENNVPCSNYFDMMPLFLDKLEMKSLILIKVNMYGNTADRLKHEMHTDQDYEHKGALFFVNDNDGVTTLEDGTEIESKANRMLMFDPSKLHCSSTCTDSKRRITINFNYL